MTGKTRIKLSVLGQLPPDFDARTLLKWKSRAFDVGERIESYDLNLNAGGSDWEYTDEQFAELLRGSFEEHIHFVFVNVPLEYDWYLRRLSNNRLVFTFKDVADVLRSHNIPLQNLALRVMYASVLVYRRYGNRIPAAQEITDYAHDEARGCIFDMNPSKIDVVFSCHQPRICDSCVSKLRDQLVSNEVIEDIQKDLQRIRKPLFNRMSDFVRNHPICSLVLSLFAAFALGTASSILGSYLYEVIVRQP